MTNNIVRKFTFDTNSKTIDCDIIRSGLEQLTQYSQDGRNVSKLLLEDIMGYEWLLAQEDPDAACRRYLEFKDKNNLRETVSRVLDMLEPTWRGVG